MPTWPAYTKETPYSIRFYDEISVEKDPSSEKDQFLLDLNIEKVTK